MTEQERYLFYKRLAEYKERSAEKRKEIYEYLENYKPKTDEIQQA